MLVSTSFARWRERHKVTFGRSVADSGLQSPDTCMYAEDRACGIVEGVLVRFIQKTLQTYCRQQGPTWPRDIPQLGSCSRCQSYSKSRRSEAGGCSVSRWMNTGIRSRCSAFLILPSLCLRVNVDSETIDESKASVSSHGALTKRRKIEQKLKIAALSGLEPRPPPWTCITLAFHSIFERHQAEPPPTDSTT